MPIKKTTKPNKKDLTAGKKRVSRIIGYNRKTTATPVDLNDIDAVLRALNLDRTYIDPKRAPAFTKSDVLSSYKMSKMLGIDRDLIEYTMKQLYKQKLEISRGSRRYPLIFADRSVHSGTNYSGTNLRLHPLGVMVFITYLRERIKNEKQIMTPTTRAIEGR